MDMDRITGFRISGAVLGIALAFGVGVAVGQSAPTENKGVKVGPPTAIGLADQIEGLEGRQLRLRVITIEPGGVAAVHSHKGRPAVAYVVQGTLTEHREGGGTKDHPAGDTLVEDKDTVHWAENKGSEPAVIVAVDVFKP
jgi:quercetin dioxygenase-like cupin family protein